MHTEPRLASQMVSLSLWDDVTHPWVVKLLSETWGTDPMVTICVQAAHAEDPQTILVAEVTNASMSKRLVLLEGTVRRATWCQTRPTIAQLHDMFHEGCVEVLVNGTRQLGSDLSLQDGDALRAVYTDDGQGIVADLGRDMCSEELNQVAEHITAIQQAQALQFSDVKKRPIEVIASHDPANDPHGKAVRTLHRRIVPQTKLPDIMHRGAEESRCLVCVVTRRSQQIEGPLPLFLTGTVQGP